MATSVLDTSKNIHPILIGNIDSLRLGELIYDAGFGLPLLIFDLRPRAEYLKSRITGSMGCHIDPHRLESLTSDDLLRQLGDLTNPEVAILNLFELFTNAWFIIFYSEPSEYTSAQKLAQRLLDLPGQRTWNAKAYFLKDGFKAFSADFPQHVDSKPNHILERQYSESDLVPINFSIGDDVSTSSKESSTRTKSTAPSSVQPDANIVRVVSGSRSHFKSKHQSSSSSSSKGKGYSSKSSRTPDRDDWSDITDPEERRRVQNRIAQRKFREKAKEDKSRKERDDENRTYSKQSYQTPNPEEMGADDELSGLPWGKLSLKHVVSRGRSSDERGSFYDARELDRNYYKADQYDDSDGYGYSGYEYLDGNSYYDKPTSSKKVEEQSPNLSTINKKTANKTNLDDPVDSNQETGVDKARLHPTGSTIRPDSGQQTTTSTVPDREKLGSIENQSSTPSFVTDTVGIKKSALKVENKLICPEPTRETRNATTEHPIVKTQHGLQLLKKRSDTIHDRVPPAYKAPQQRANEFHRTGDKYPRSVLPIHAALDSEVIMVGENESPTVLDDHTLFRPVALTDISSAEIAASMMGKEDLLPPLESPIADVPSTARISHWYAQLDDEWKDILPSDHRTIEKMLKSQIRGRIYEKRVLRSPLEIERESEHEKDETDEKDEKKFEEDLTRTPCQESIARDDITFPDGFLEALEENNLDFEMEFTSDSAIDEINSSMSSVHGPGSSRERTYSAPVIAPISITFVKLEAARRLQWTCRCGHKSYDDFQELRKGGVQDFADELLKSGYITHAQVADQTSTKPSRLAIGSNNLFVGAKRRIGRFRTSLLPTFSTSVPIGSTPMQCVPAQNCRWLHMCLKKRPYATKLKPLHLCKDDDQRDFMDATFFEVLRKTYRMQKSWSERLLFKLRKIEFVEFELCPDEFVDHIIPNKLPPTTDEYDFQPPPPPKKLPPIGEAHLMHLFTSCSAPPLTTSLYLRHIPRKKNQAICFQADKIEGNTGWGLHFVETLNGSLAVTVMFIVSLVLGVAFAVCWSIWKKDVQGAFGVAAYLTSVMTLAVMTWQMWAT